MRVQQRARLRDGGAEARLVIDNVSCARPLDVDAVGDARQPDTGLRQFVAGGQFRIGPADVMRAGGLPAQEARATSRKRGRQTRSIWGGSRSASNFFRQNPDHLLPGLWAAGVQIKPRVALDDAVIERTALGGTRILIEDIERV